MVLPRREIEILSVEDNQADVFLLKKVFASCNSSVKFTFMGDGEAAMNFLLKQHPHENAVTPDLILLDLNLPRMDGRETLRELKRHPKLGLIPTVILTTSSSDKDIQICYELHANCYFVKPQELDDYRQLAKNIIDTWFHWASLPQEQRQTTERI